MSRKKYRPLVLSQWQKRAVVLLIGLFCTIFVLWPIVTNIRTRSTSSIDGPLIAWLVNHASEWYQGKGALYSPPFFYPFKNTLTFSDPFLSSGLIAAFLQVVLPNFSMIGQLNLQLVGGTLLYFMSMYWLIRELGGRGAAALLIATIATFLPLRFVYVVHLHTHLTFGIPLGVLFLRRYLRQPKLLYLIGFSLAYLFQLFNAPMTAYFFLATVFIYVFSQKMVWSLLLADKRIWFISVLLGLISIGFYFPYWQQAAQFHSERTIRDAAHFSYAVNRLWGWDILVVAGLCILFFLSSRKSKRNIRQLLPWVVITLVGLVAMLGPVLKFDLETVKLFGLPVPLPYAVAYYLIPGLKAFRSVTRWSTLAALGFPMITLLLYQTSRIKNGLKTLLLLILAVYSVLIARRNLPVFSIDTQVPEIYQLAAEQPEQVMAILPATVWSMVPYDGRESVRLLYQPASHKVYYNGASGYLPPTRAEEIHQLFSSFPDDETLEMLRANGVELLLVEYEQYQQMFSDRFVFGDVPAPDPDLVKSKLEQRIDVDIIQCSQNNCLYQLW